MVAEEQSVRFQATGRQHRGCIIPQAVTHSLVLLKMGKIIARNLLHIVGCLYYLYQWYTVKRISNLQVVYKVATVLWTAEI